ncbi:MAG: hypothetical protein QOH69_2450 [Actinomycetota bacterium]|jgi:hypothetical protein|nr:hypothetical protein [Actinomycetota bacterium]
MPAPDTASPASSSPTRLRTVAIIAAGATIAILANLVIATMAHAAGAASDFSPLQVFVYAPFTLVGLIAAYRGWLIVRRRARHPAAVLRILVPVLTVLSFAPDTILAIAGFIPGASLTAVIALGLMHLVVVAIAVPICAKLAPVR